MRNYKIYVVLLIILCATFAEPINADTNRPIYIGDLIELHLHDNEMTPTEITDLFQPFEIVSIQDVKDGYIVVLRSFEPGRWEFDIKGQLVIIEIETLMDNSNMEADTIIEGEYELFKPGVYIPFSMIIVFLSIIFIVSLAYTLMNRYKKKSEESVSASDIFKLEVENIRLNDGELVFKLQESLNDYFYRCMDKKTGEFVELEHSNNDYYKYFCKENSIPDELFTELKEWYKLGEFYKYSGVTMSMEKKQDYLDQLKIIFQSINKFVEVEI